ncbi:MAG: glycosyltransferase family 4 protein [Anaerolineae bacterium]|nr:glycosyltransferase family 4 protein [Anaerolineae bacterium]
MDRLNDPSKPLKICYLARYTGGGSAISLQTIVSNLDRSRFLPIVLFHRIKNHELVAALRARDIPVFSLTEPYYFSTTSSAFKVNVTGRLSRSTWQRKLLSLYQLGKATGAFIKQDLKLIRPLLHFLNEHQVDLIHFNSGLSTHRADLLVSNWLGIPAICHVRAFETLTPLERFVGRKVKRFFYISQAIAQDYQNQKIAPHRGQIIHNVVSPPPLITPAEKMALRAEFGWDETHFVVVNVGRLVSWKGQDVFIKAIDCLAPRLPHLRGLLVGKADDNPGSYNYAQNLQQLVTDKGLTDKVIFAGFRSDAVRLMAAADVVVHSATTPEPFGRVIIEGLATGTAVVATNDGGVADIITPGVNGMLVTPGDDSEMARTIEELAHNPTLRAKLGQAGYEHVKENFSVAGQLKQLEQAYLACLTR